MPVKVPLLILAALCLLQAMPAAAQDWLDRGVLAELKPGPKRYFYAGDENKGCPAVTAACRRRAFVVAGDALIAGETRGGFTNVIYTADGGRTTEGWVETAALRSVDPVPHLPAPWIGAWTVNSVGWDASLTITRSAKPGMVHIEGGVEGGTDNRWWVEHGAIRIGLFAAEVVVVGERISFSVGDSDEPGAVSATSEEGEEMGTLAYDAPDVGNDTFGDDRCRIRIRLLGPYLLATDNNACGAQGVSFTGVYRR
jgi:hypothetical protein